MVERLSGPIDRTIGWGVTGPIPNQSARRRMIIHKSSYEEENDKFK